MFLFIFIYYKVIALKKFHVQISTEHLRTQCLIMQSRTVKSFMVMLLSVVERKFLRQTVYYCISREFERSLHDLMTLQLRDNARLRLQFLEHHISKFI